MSYTPYLDPLQVYRNRDYIHGAVDDRVFDLLNYETSGVWAGKLAFTGCLDAIEDIPAGGMSNAYGVRSQLVAYRDGTKHFNDLIDDLLNEE